jgi:hypothetical protein
MYIHQNIVCNHLLQFLANHHINTVFGQHKDTDKYAKKFNTRSLFLSLLLAQILQVDSIRWLETILQTQSNKLYHIWMKPFHRSTFSDRVNKTHPTLFQNLFYHLVSQAKTLLGQHKNIHHKKIYAIDSSLISLTLSVFNRAYYRKKKWAIKLHTRMNIELWIPDLVVITEWKKADSPLGKRLLQNIESWSILLMDRWYLDYTLLATIEEKRLSFISRTKSSAQYCPIHQNPIVHPQIQYDAIVEFVYEKAKQAYSWHLRVIRRVYTDEKTWQKKILEFLTNNLDLPAHDIAMFYKMRRQIELLFKWIKQNCVIKSFLGTSQNAVENQIRVALCYYILLMQIKHSTNTTCSMLKLTRKIAILIFERVSFIYVIWEISPKKIILAAQSPPYNSLFSY